MTPLPTLTTDRLVLRAFEPADADAVTSLAGAREIAATTIRIPHPYPPGLAAEWIATHRARFAAGHGLPFAVTLSEDGRLVGAIGLEVDPGHGHAELGYWIGVPFWNRGYATEAARVALEWGFETLALHRVHAHHFASNPASGRVLEKIGMQREGVLRQHVLKWETYEDAVMYGILRAEWESRPVS